MGSMGSRGMSIVPMAQAPRCGGRCLFEKYEEYAYLSNTADNFPAAFRHLLCTEASGTNRSKSLGRTCSVALRVAKRYLFGPFVVRVPAKFTLKASLKPPLRTASEAMFCELRLY